MKRPLPITLRILAVLLLALVMSAPVLVNFLIFQGTLLERMLFGAIDG